MARLLRLHFASIGHRHARLSPLTLDFRALSAEREPGSGIDSILWLRNGGGKSSVINLFYSVLRPNRSEFLGSSAEGKARRIEDYVKTQDLAFVISEWDIDPANGDEDFERPPSTVRIIGQALAWRNQQRTELRRVFFSARSIPGVLELEHLPVLGLGEPCASFGEFRQWLRDTIHRHPETEIADTSNQRNWRDNLEKLGIDTELFRYQLQMNQREGAADELFRFGTAQDFIDFFLELTLEREGAEQLAKNIEAQRETLRKRPEFLLEQQFISSIRASLVPLVDAVEHERACTDELDHAHIRAAALIAGLDERGAQLELRRGELERSLSEAREDHSRARNERDKQNRWSRGLERRALELELHEAEQALDFAEQSKRELDQELRVNKAAAALQEVRTSEAQVEHWTQERRRSELELAPQREQLESTGSALRTLLARARAVREADAQARERERATRRAEAEQARAEVNRCERELGRLQQELANLDAQLRHYKQARERLLAGGVLQTHETASSCVERWQSNSEELQRRGREAERQRETIAGQLHGLGERVQELGVRRATRSEQLREHRQELQRAYDQRDELRASPLLIEVEETEEPELDTPGLGRRLRQRAESERHQLLQSRVDGAEDSRAIAAIDDGGLWPANRDVQLTVGALRDAGVAAHPGLGYVAENVPADARADAIRSAPATFAGVIVIGDHMSRVRERLSDLPRLHTPVQITRIQSLVHQQPERDEERLVVAPDPATYDREAATERKLELERTRGERQQREAEHTERERAFLGIADQLARYLEAYGKGALEHLEQAAHAATTELEQIEDELEELASRRKELELRSTTLLREREELAQREREALTKLQAVEAFVEHYERQVGEARERREAALRERDAHEREREVQRRRVESLSELADSLHARMHEAHTAARELAREHDGIQHHDDSPLPEPPPELELTRERYQALRLSYETKLGESLARSMLEESTRTLTKHRQRYDKLAASLETAVVETKLRSCEDLEGEREQLERDRDEANADVGKAKSERDSAMRALAETRKRREASDLPPDVDPASADEARERARGCAEQVERLNESIRRVETAIADFEGKLRTLAEQRREYSHAASKLRTMLDAVGFGLPSVEAVAPPLELDALDRVVEQHRETFTICHKRRDAAREATRDLCGELRTCATATTYSELDRQYKDRLAAGDEELRERAATLRDDLDHRLTVLERQLEQYDRDRKLLVQHLLRLTDEAERVLKRAQRASSLPEGLDAWSGRPYLRLRYTLPETDLEREARLGPLVDQILEAGALPSGAVLVRRAMHELARPGGFDVRILKPDTVLRPDPIPIAAMASFSRGQQLTAAILLYCTLVQLRAQNRGRGRGRKDGGVLVLDNPLGTCSTVALVQLQRRIARQMKVQLIYTTGIEDREAISVMPNTIRLRNTHRDARTGDHHITGESEGAVEQARIVEAASS
ncbi:Chromosome partition protein Smc [Enhygromyxa salina]|uniref:Chromosome partition protein Smc n=1 Tax=Enhygromyxa salina TaxID=215803 RepID=A0A2S9XAL1_9BACT|nr:hypothetical protein [Enhygromyxa salina]PRP89897.1 Chromosome partition protein Smc [Enhygromyxa salina]